MSGRECWRKWLSFGYQFLRVSSCQLEPKQKPHFDNRSYLFQMGDAGMDAAASEGGSTPPPPTTNHARVAAKLSSSSSSSFHPPNSIMTPATKNCQHFHLPPRGGNSVTTARTRRRCKTGKRKKKKLPWKRRTRPPPPPLQQPLETGLPGKESKKKSAKQIIQKSQTVNKTRSNKKQRDPIFVHFLSHLFGRKEKNIERNLPSFQIWFRNSQAGISVSLSLSGCCRTKLEGFFFQLPFLLPLCPLLS